MHVVSLIKSFVDALLRKHIEFHYFLGYCFYLVPLRYDSKRRFVKLFNGHYSNTMKTVLILLCTSLCICLLPSVIQYVQIEYLLMTSEYPIFAQASIYFFMIGVTRLYTVAELIMRRQLSAFLTSVVKTINELLTLRRKVECICQQRCVYTPSDCAVFALKMMCFTLQIHTMVVYHIWQRLTVSAVFPYNLIYLCIFEYACSAYQFYFVFTLALLRNVHRFLHDYWEQLDRSIEPSLPVPQIKNLRAITKIMQRLHHLHVRFAHNTSWFLTHLYSPIFSSSFNLYAIIRCIFLVQSLTVTERVVELAKHNLGAFALPIVDMFIVILLRSHIQQHVFFINDILNRAAMRCKVKQLRVFQLEVNHVLLEKHVSNLELSPNALGGWDMPFFMDYIISNVLYSLGSIQYHVAVTITDDMCDEF